MRPDHSASDVSTPTPQIQLETLFHLDGRHRIRSTREPNPTPGPAFILIRGKASCAWASRSDVAPRIADELDRLASQEPATEDWMRPLRHGERYEAVLAGPIRCGPAFEFPGPLWPPGQEVIIHDEAMLTTHFSGWIKGEIGQGRSPVLAVCAGGHPVSVCFCARRSDVAAEAGIETAVAFRRRGYAVRAANAWASLVRQMGLVPIYSTDWQNLASLAVARNLGLTPFATDFRIDG